MARLRNEGNTATLFQFTDGIGAVKILHNGSLSPKFKVNVRRNKRLKNKDILHKKGISNREFTMIATLSGTDRFTNLTTLSALAEAETTVYLDTEGIHDTYNGTYLFEGNFDHDINQKFRLITVKFRLIEEAN